MTHKTNAGQLVSVFGNSRMAPEFNTSCIDYFLILKAIFTINGNSGMYNSRGILLKQRSNETSHSPFYTTAFILQTSHPAANTVFRFLLVNTF